MATTQPVVFLHIGAMKTGTTFLQQLLSANREALAEAGYLFPGQRWGDQTRATRDILGLGADPRVKARTAGYWEKLSGQMLAHQGRASLFSMEFLSFATREKAARVVDSLDGATVHVVLTVRDAIGALPAQWQSNARNKGRTSWPAFVRAAMAAAEEDHGWRRRRQEIDEGGRTFLRTQNIPLMLQAWTTAVPPERVHVVTVPPPDADRMLLWRRFAEVIGADPAVCSHPSPRSNSSLGHASADLMRRVNERLGKIPRSDYEPTLKHYLARQVLSRRAGQEARAGLDLPTLEFATSWNRRVRNAIERSGVELVGDLADLPVEVPEALRAKALPSLAEPDPEHVLAAAVDARLGLLELVEARNTQLRKAGGSAVAVPDRSSGGPQAWAEAPVPLEAAVDEVTELTRTAIALHGLIRDLSDTPAAATPTTTG